MILLTGVPKEESLHIYITHLNAEIATEVMQANPTSVADAINAAQKAEDLLKRFGKRKQTQQQHSWQTQATYSGYNGNGLAYSGPMPMHLTAVMTSNPYKKKNGKGKGNDIHNIHPPNPQQMGKLTE